MTAPAAAPAPEAPPEPATQAAADASEAAATETAEPTAPTPAPAPAAPEATPASGNGRTFVSPVVARIASEHGVDPNAVQGTGTGGRVTKKDILAFVEGGGQAQAAHRTGCQSRRPHRSPHRPRPRLLRPLLPLRLRRRRPPPPRSRLPHLSPRRASPPPASRSSR